MDGFAANKQNKKPKTKVHIINHCRNTRSKSCPFCRDSLKEVNAGDLWVLIDNRDIVDIAVVKQEDVRRLIMYINRLPEVVPDSTLRSYDSHIR